MTISHIKKDVQCDNPMRQRVEINGRELFMDVPPMFGGTDSASTPHDFIDAALLGCKAITIRMIAAKQGLPLQDVNISLNSDASQESKGRYIMNLDIELIGDLNSEQRQALFHAAEKYCPTGRMLSGDIKVEINAQLV